MEATENTAQRPSASTLEAIEIEELLLALARVRGRLEPAPCAWRVHDVVERMRRLMLAPQ